MKYDISMKYEDNTKTILCFVINQKWDNNEICREVS